MNTMTATLNTHPLAVGSDGYTNILFLEGKVNSQSSADDHERVYIVKFTTTLGFTLTMGYSRYKDQAGTTHAWIAFGDKCSSHWQKELGVDLLLNLVGYRCMYGSDGHPAVGGPDMGLAATMLASSSVPEPAQAPASSAQPLAAMPSTSMAASSVSLQRRRQHPVPSRPQAWLPAAQRRQHQLRLRRPAPSHGQMEQAALRHHPSRWRRVCHWVPKLHCTHYHPSRRRVYL